jgi:hypothetical protein
MVGLRVAEIFEMVGPNGLEHPDLNRVKVSLNQAYNNAHVRREAAKPSRYG